MILYLTNLIKSNIYYKSAIITAFTKKGEFFHNGNNSSSNYEKKTLQLELNEEWRDLNELKKYLSSSVTFNLLADCSSLSAGTASSAGFCWPISDNFFMKSPGLFNK